MKKVLLLTILLATILPLSAQKLDCAELMTVKVIAKSGMRMRSKPSLKGSMVTSVPYDSLLQACQNTYGQMTYENITGYWRKVNYRGKIGYMFDGFLEIVSLKNLEAPGKVLNDSMATAGTGTSPQAPPVEDKQTYTFLTETYNYCGDIRGIDPGLLWYGIYPPDEDQGGQYYRIKPVELQVVMSQYSVGKELEFDIETKSEERSIFLFGSNKKMDITGYKIEDHDPMLRYTDRKIFPGQEIQLTEGAKPIRLSATGAVESSGPCPDLKNYKLKLTGEKYFLPVEQDLTKEIVNSGQCGMPEVYWFGDLTGDDIPEIIFVSVYEDRNLFTLFMSDPAKDNILLKKQAEWVVQKCY